VKPSLIVAVALVICIYLSPRCEGQERPKARANSTAAENQKGRPPAVEIPYKIQNQWIQTETSESRKESPPWYKAPEWMLVGVGVITFIVIGWQSLETRRAANAAISANSDAKKANTDTLAAISRQADLMDGQIKQAARHLALTERPWIMTKLRLVGPFEYYSASPPPRMHVHLLVEVMNEGNTPAINIEVQPTVYVMHMGLNLAKQLREVATTVKAVSKANPIFGDMLFPRKEPLLKRWTIAVTMEDIETLGHSDGLFGLAIILGVGYRSTIDDEACHCTVTLYDFNRLDPQYPNQRFVFSKGQAVALDSLVLSPSMFMAPIAE
jgi:hypothetical protein